MSRCGIYVYIKCPPAYAHKTPIKLKKRLLRACTNVSRTNLMQFYFFVGENPVRRTPAITPAAPGTITWARPRPWASRTEFASPFEPPTPCLPPPGPCTPELLISEANLEPHTRIRRRTLYCQIRFRCVHLISSCWNCFRNNSRSCFQGFSHRTARCA